MAERLRRLEEAEELVIQLLKAAGQAVGELKEIQANDTDKTAAVLKHTNDYYSKLANIKQILNEELKSLENITQAPTRRPGIDKLAIAEWEAKVIADNLHELIHP